MLIELALLATAAAMPEVSGEFSGYKRQIGVLTSYERIDMQLTNNADEARTLRVCPNDADMVLRTHQRSSRPAFAIAFGKDSWSYNCLSRDLAAGEAVSLKMYFSPQFEFGPSRDVLLKTNLGSFFVTDGESDLPGNLGTFGHQ